MLKAALILTARPTIHNKHYKKIPKYQKQIARKKDRALLDGSLMYKEKQWHSTTENVVNNNNNDAPIEKIHYYINYLHLVFYKSVWKDSWKEKDCKRQGIVDADPEELVDGVMKEFQDFVCLDDIVDI
eukprot:2869302-Ditylum_brightwellii.AAC.1